MADNDLVSDVNVATDELVTLNGQAQADPKPKAQRVKLLVGDDGVGVDVSPAARLPVALPDGTTVIVTLDAASLAALETINVGNLPADPPTQTTLAAILTELGQKLEAGQPVALDAATLAALEAITVSNPTDVSGLATAAKQDKLLTAATAVSYGTGTANATAVAPADGPGRLVGYAVREAAATPAAAVVRFRSGTTVAGTPLGAGVSLAPGESVREWFGPAGINVPTAVFLERVSGTTEVTVYWSAP